MILREAFIIWINGGDWRVFFKLTSDFELVTSQKNIAEIYAILRTSILESDLKVYGLVGSQNLKELLFDGDNFLNIFWYHQVLENTHRSGSGRTDKSGKNLQALIDWRNGYERVCRDFDNFLKTESIAEVHYGHLFTHHEWQQKIYDLARETLMPSEDWEIVVAAYFTKADIFLTREDKLVRFSFSLGLEPAPVFAKPENFEAKVEEKIDGVLSFPYGN